MKAKIVVDAIAQPVWCSKCYLRIAPYEGRKKFQFKDYHLTCLLKLTQPRALKESGEVGERSG